MSVPIILSDDEGNTPLPSLSKKPKTTTTTTTILVLDDDPTSSTDLSILKGSSDFLSRVSIPGSKLPGKSEFICLESEKEDSDDDFAKENLENYRTGNSDDDAENIGCSSRFIDSMDVLGDANLAQSCGDNSSAPYVWQDDFVQVGEDPDKENCSNEQISNSVKQKGSNFSFDSKCCTNQTMGKRKLSREERTRLIEEKRKKKEEDKLRKASMKAQAAELKKLEKEKQKWEKGKLALKSIIAILDTKVVEQGSIGGYLLTRFSEKSLTYRLASNPIEKSIVWTMSVPEHISQLSPKGTEIHYVLIVYEAEEFCNLVANESLLDLVSRVQSCYPSHTVCFLTNRLMAYVNKREKEQYKNQEKANGWIRPPIEEMLAKLTTHFVRVHYRHCADEAELAEHVVGLTSSLASCQFRNRLTRLSVNANGSFVPKDFVDNNLIKRSPWLKALVAIPKVQPRFAVAIWKKYPTMKSLLRVYMDPNKSVHEKESLLEDLSTEGLFGGERRVGKICSKRIYRILMAQNGNIKTDDVEDGADFFTHQQL